MGLGGFGMGKDDDSDDDYESVSRRDHLDSCCCCCCPIKCGVQVIGALTMLLTFYYISWNFFLILNDQVTWWFPVVTIVLLIPFYLSSAFFVNWFIKDELSSRSKLTGAIIL